MYKSYVKGLYVVKYEIDGIDCNKKTITINDISYVTKIDNNRQTFLSNEYKFNPKTRLKYDMFYDIIFFNDDIVAYTINNMTMKTDIFSMIGIERWDNLNDSYIELKNTLLNINIIEKILE